MKKFLKLFFFLGLLLLLVSAFAIVTIFNKYGKDLPNYQQLKDYTPMVTTRIYDTEGSLITEYSKEKRIFIPIEMIPKDLINAFLAAEDDNFYNHKGIDPLAIIRSIINNTISKYRGQGRVAGGSTITQQVVKNFLLTNERTIERKIKEAILAIRMTNSFTKDQVLELYLNQIYLGSGSYGVSAAAQEYFNKSVEELTIEECALLATLPKAPSKLDPRQNIEKAKIRRDWVITRMLEENYVDPDKALLAINQPITLTQISVRSTKAEFFADAVKKRLTELYGSDDVFESGIVVRTSLKPKLQKIAQDALEKGIEFYDRKHGYRGPVTKLASLHDWKTQLKNLEIEKLYKTSWKKAVILKDNQDHAEIGLLDGSTGILPLTSFNWAKKYIDVNTQGPSPTKVSEVVRPGDVVMVSQKDPQSNIYELQQIPAVNGAFIAMDPHTGRILAMSGGYVDAPNQFNRATQARRQTGSTIKTFGYIAALENGMTPASIIIDEEVSLDQGPDLPPYKPTNYSDIFYGPTTLRTGLEKSRNVTTVRMADQVGLEKVAEVVRRFGINDDPKPIYSLVLGSSETSLIRLATAYSIIVNGGKKVTPTMIEKIQDRNGTTIYKRDTRICNICSINDADALASDHIEELPVPFLEDIKERITDSATAYQITSMLQGAIENGTGVGAKSVGKIIGGKTGTTNNSFDSWFVGFSPDLVATVYIGFDIPKTLGENETGASIALPIFVDFMKKALANTPSTPFRIPNSVKFVKIDRMSGKLATTDTEEEDIFFEAFKLGDKVESDTSEMNIYKKFKSNQDTIDVFDSDNSDSDLMGIY